MKPETLATSPLAMSSKPRLIVCERSGQWAAGLKRAAVREVSIRETRSLAECQAELSQNPSSFVVVELTATNIREVLEFVARIGRDFRWARSAVVAERRLAECEWAMREAGAVYFAMSPSAARDITRFAVRQAAFVPQPKRSLATRIWDSLPWPEATTG